jgi:hypothetical protein
MALLEPLSAADSISVVTQLTALISESVSASAIQASDSSIITGSVIESIIAADSVTARFFWEPIDDDENADWNAVNDSQTPGWTDVVDAQSPSWVEITTV